MTARRDFLIGGLSAGVGALAGTQLGPAIGQRQKVDPGGATRTNLLVGDGETDNRALLERTFAGIPMERGGTIVLPPGDYRLAGPLAVPPHVTLGFERGARLVGEEEVKFLGSLEAGLYQIFVGVRVVFEAGSRQWSVPQWWGARGDGENDDSDAIQSALDTRSVFLPAGHYRTTKELVIRNRTTVKGVGNSWSPTARTDSWIRYDGPIKNESAVLRTASAPVGIEPEQGLTNVHLEKLVLDGGNQAGYGLYSVYCTDDSSFSDVTARHCTEHGIFISRQWYSSYRNLVARDNPGCGITIGKQFDGWSRGNVNGICFLNLRAANNGTDKSFDETENRERGYGILFRPGGGSRLQHAVSENNDGPGLIYDLGGSCSNCVDGAYLEGNGRAAEDRRATRPWGVVVIGNSNARANELSSLYLHGAVGNDRAQSIWLTGDAPAGDLILRNVSFGQHLHAEWPEYDFDGFIYHGIRNYIVGEMPRGMQKGSPGATDAEQ